MKLSRVASKDFLKESFLVLRVVAGMHSIAVQLVI